MLQHMAGSMPDKTFNDLPLRSKRIILGQMADIFSLIQKFELPSTVNGFGGLRFDEGGEVVSAQMTLVKGGPWEGYEELVMTDLAERLKTAEETVVIGGWRANDVRERLDRWLESGLGTMIKEVPRRNVCVHADLSKLYHHAFSFLLCNET